MPARSWIIRMADASGDLVVIGQIALELLVAVIVIDPFLLLFRFRGTGPRV